MTKPKTQAQLDRDADLRYRKAYNITLKDYEFLDTVGNHGCWICGRPATNNRLHVDHDHGWKKVKIETMKTDEWKAWATYNATTYCGYGTKKSIAVLSVKRQLLRASVRGLLCYQHNAGLQKFSDSGDWMRAAAFYLDDFHKISPLSGRSPT
jgi:hypothetical protein